MSAGSSFESGARVGQQRRNNQAEDKKREAAKAEEATQEKIREQNKEASRQTSYYTTDSAPNDTLTDAPVRKSEGGKYGDGSAFNDVMGRKSQFDYE